MQTERQMNYFCPNCRKTKRMDRGVGETWTCKTCKTQITIKRMEAK